MKQRRFLPTISELIDRLSIVQLKEVKIPEHKEEYAQEIADIVHDIQLCLDSSETPPTDDQPMGTIVFNSNPSLGGPLGWVSLGGARWANFGIID